MDHYQVYYIDFHALHVLKNEYQLMKFARHSGVQAYPRIASLFDDVVHIDLAIL